MTSEGVAPAAMTDASKRLFDAVDDGVGEAGTTRVDASATVPPTPMNRTMRAWQNAGRKPECSQCPKPPNQCPGCPCNLPHRQEFPSQ